MKFNKEKFFNIILILLFVFLSILICGYHEPWADEAQSWLIARDASIKDILFKFAHRDGHPVLWYLILKFFIYLGLPYKRINLISIFFSSIGVGLFVCKSKFNKLIKILFSFSYFVFYQYNIIARGYCLILVLISLIAILWQDRHKKIYLFSFLLILLLSSESYTFLLAGCIFFYLIVDFFKNEYTNKKSHIICFVLLFLMFLFTTLYCFPRSSNTFNPSNSIFNFYFLSYSFFAPIIGVGTNLSNKFVEIILSFELLLSVIILFYFYFIYKKDKYNMYQFFFFIGIPMLFLIFKYYNAWHCGIMTIIVIFCFWIHSYQNNKLVKIFLIFSFLCQIPWTINSIYCDIKHPYSSSLKAAIFIKEYDYDNMKIYANTFYSISLNPYFDNNIYYNLDKENAFFDWDINSNYYKILKNYLYKKNKIVNYGKLNINFYLDNNIDIIVDSTSNMVDNSLYKDLKKYYNKYIFKENMVFELDEYECHYTVIFVKKEKDWRSDYE